MAIDYEKLDNWDAAKTIFGKIIGKKDYEHINKKLKIFDPIEKLIKSSDKAANAVIKGLKKNNLIPEDAQAVILKNNNDLKDENAKLIKALDDNLDDKYDEAIESLTAEIELYRNVYGSLLKTANRGKKEDLEKLKELFSKNQFLQDGSFEYIFGLGEEALQVVARSLREYTSKKDTVTKEDGEKLYDLYNRTLPSNKNGMRSITTFLKSFVEYEIFFEKHNISNTEFKNMKLHSELKDYETFRNYTKGAVLFIKKLSPWATTEGNLLTKAYIEEKTNEGSAAVIKDIAERLMTGKRTLIQAKTFFIKFF